jgi:hypothetical protein
MIGEGIAKISIKARVEAGAEVKRTKKVNLRKVKMMKMKKRMTIWVAHPIE